jgi:hypothetical protein
MVTIGKLIQIQGEFFEVVRILRIGIGKVLPLELIEEGKRFWHAEKVFKQQDHYYFVNEIKSIEPITDDEDRNTRETTTDSTENTAGGQMDLGRGDRDQEEHN